MISQSEADHQLYLSRRKYALDEQSRRADSLWTRIIIGRIQSLESQLGLPETRVEQLDALMMDDLRRMEAELKAKLANRS